MLKGLINDRIIAEKNKPKVGTENAQDSKMSYVFGYQSNAQDAENQVGRRGKAMTTRSNAQGAPKRAALGVITNQVNQQVRVQPKRAAKPKVGKK